ncbi:MAG: beta-N-acetylhexosaminidase [Anaerolineales bacterium]|jgi:hexosaminidase
MKYLIPMPTSIQPAAGSFVLSASSQIFVSPDSEAMLQIGQRLAEYLCGASGFPLPIAPLEGALPEGAIHLTSESADSSLGDEGYTLEVTPQAVRIASPQPAGVFCGLQTLRQLLPAEIGSNAAQPGPWQIAAVSIRDTPRFAWRGAMLDVARHFFGVEEVKKYIDLLAAYKFNILHLHLTDDQGWRIEVKAWPNLTQYGGETAVGGDPGGFYTQADYAEIVKYARQRYITVVPEIDMPGHTNAALASYPELNCEGNAPKRYTGIEVGFSSLCIEKEITYQFVSDVLQEVATLTPGPYIHIGGDEAHSTSKAAYKTFIERVEAVVAGLGKQMVGWEEIAQWDLSPSTLVQYWKNMEYARLAAEKGSRVILSPAPRTYLDMKYHDDTTLGLNWAGTIDVEKAYDWDPVGEVDGLDEQATMGVEAPLWSETIRTMQDLEFMALPRLLSIAEVSWSPAATRDWESFRQRLAAHGQRLRHWKVNYYADPKIAWS